MDGEGFCQKVADLEGIGRVIRRAREIAGIERKELAADLGHADDTTLYKWEKGTGGNPPLVKMLGLPKFKAGFVVALAEATGGFTVETVVRSRRTA